MRLLSNTPHARTHSHLRSSAITDGVSGSNAVVLAVLTIFVPVVGDRVDADVDDARVTVAVGGSGESMKLAAAHNAALTPALSVAVLV
jgi:hypothetical protein